MHNIITTVQLISAAEKVNNSRNLTDAEKIELLTAIRESALPGLPGTPSHVKIVAASIERMMTNERAREAQKQGRKTEGVEESTEVVAGRAEEGAEASEGSTEGVAQQAKDAGSSNKAKSGKSRASGKGKN